MSLFRRLLACLCALVIICSLSSPVYAEETRTVRDILQQMLNYYYHYQTDAETDVYRLLEEMRLIDAEEAALWQNIFDYWFYATDELPKNETALPDDLPDNDSLCIVVLGYRLETDGEMAPELIGRLELALQAAVQYPNAYVLCTGGGTASEKPGVTEAGQMARWLKKQGIDQDRIITESSSTHTIQNAQYSFGILSARYPQIRQLVIVTSDYHLTRSTTLFHAEALHTASELDTDPITIAACLGYEAGHEGIAEDPLDQAAHLARLSGFEFEKAEAPALSKLTDLTVSGNTLLEPGTELQLTVTAHYDSGFSRDVTEACVISDYDPDSEHSQLLTFTYSENGSQIMTTVEICRPAKETAPPATEPPETVPFTEPPITTIPDKELNIPWVPIALTIAAAIGLLLLRKKK